MAATAPAPSRRLNNASDDEIGRMRAPMNGSAYLDYNSGAPLRPLVAEAMAACWTEAGNPSSIHGPGRAARRRLETARAQVAALVGADPHGLVFTSGGTEANAQILAGSGAERLIVSSIEHPAIAEPADRAGAATIPVGRDGIIDLAALERLLSEDDRPALVSVMLANNETGVIQPVAEAARLAHAHGALLHCDAAQAAGRIEISLAALNADFLTLSAHKMGGPPGIGALVLADPSFPVAPFLLGGGQESRRRAGTENLPGIVGFGTCATLVGDDLNNPATTSQICTMRDRLERAALTRLPQAMTIGAEAPRLGNTACLALPGLPGRTQVMALDLAGVAVSAGPACASGRQETSRVLTAMGLGPDIAGSAIRISLGWASREGDIDRFLAAWTDLARRKGFTVSQAEAA
ncbi:cysteine desulfurase family protein [Magnetospirillum molischianum]|uniref:Cysteine desulfurase n=1 Tax=Magnetospirillum molischianum DSM 120 TaxID=1150626 RepID=H8FQI0_MAGML|nr:cysteine desulfurase family protein [Magnetospirillum molischianum]CCG40618.1 Cysteine desulfurase (Nitrogenase metalloclusters biosynthesis protein nifS) [Magnetospirillum molischianum DSM 120]